MLWNLTVRDGKSVQSVVYRRARSLTFCVAVVLCKLESNPAAAQVLSSVKAGQELVFGADGRFKVLQIADVHFGEAESTVWGPRQDHKSMEALRRLLTYERPDLVVFSGDQLTGNNIDGNATAYWEQVVAPVEAFGTPWAAVFGNHDTMPLWPLPASRPGAKTSRAQLMAFDRQHPNSRSRAAEPALRKAVSTYSLEVLGNSSSYTASGPAFSSSNRKVARARLFFFDTGSDDFDEVVYADQVAWFQNVAHSGNPERDFVPERLGIEVASFAYFHIPLPAYKGAFGRSGCVGSQNDSEVDTVAADSGLFQALLDARVRATFVGHDHGNDWCCPVFQSDNASALSSARSPNRMGDPTPRPGGLEADAGASITANIEKGHQFTNAGSLKSQEPGRREHGMWMCFGRHSGYGGYGTWARGARVLQLTLDVASNAVRADTWIRMEFGEKIGALTLQEPVLFGTEISYV